MIKLDLPAIYSALERRYGDLNWWPAKTPYEVIVGAVLTQNTNWSNVELALANFGGPPEPAFIETASIERLIELIRPAGFFNQKARYLKNITAWFKAYDYDVHKVQQRDAKALRAEILAVHGIGRETADSIMLYAFGFPEFVVDAYTKRLLERMGLEPMDYERVKALFQEQMPKDERVYNNFHAAIVINAKRHCRKKPDCRDCPLGGICGKL
ncbi:MAG: endonuclease [Clostridiales bacterium]|jgi:endonuclease-3 related protein|nr:endonuclease [Clostridiales bacterium]